MKELAADGIPIAVTRRVLKLARQPYCRWLANPITDAELAEGYRANAQFDAHRDDPEFGYRFLINEAAYAGGSMAERTAWRICSTHGWWSAFGKKRGKNGGPARPCTMIWWSETSPPIHQINCGSAILLSIVLMKTSSTCVRLRVFFTPIVGYSIDSRMKSRLATQALARAVARRGDVAGCIRHTDRGSQFRSRNFAHALGRYDMAGSMGRVGRPVTTRPWRVL